MKEATLKALLGAPSGIKMRTGTHARIYGREGSRARLMARESASVAGTYTSSDVLEPIAYQGSGIARLASAPVVELAREHKACLSELGSMSGLILRREDTLISSGASALSVPVTFGASMPTVLAPAIALNLDALGESVDLIVDDDALVVSGEQYRLSTPLRTGTEGYDFTPAPGFSVRLDELRKACDAGSPSQVWEFGPQTLRIDGTVVTSARDGDSRHLVMRLDRKLVLPLIRKLASARENVHVSAASSRRVVLRAGERAAAIAPLRSI